MNSCIIFGGTGYIGSSLANNQSFNSLFDTIYLVDIREPNMDLIGKASNWKFIQFDVREEITDPDLLDKTPDWIFNLAAIHREPGHSYREYFETNIKGAINVCNYAEKVNCKNIFFTSSISVYGPCLTPKNEKDLPSPITPYGGSKFPAELIHKNWRTNAKERRLIVTRPGVIYGPGDPGNIFRMIKAIKKGYFFFPGKRNILKSYGYIYGLIDSIIFTMKMETKKEIVYNYCEYPTESIGELANQIKGFLGKSLPLTSISQFILIPVSKVFQLLLGGKNPIHPVRVKKAATPTYVIPKFLIDNGFQFKYDFKESLIHWEKVRPTDFKF